MNVAALLAERAAACGGTPAVVEPSRTTSFVELHRASGHIAAQLADSGIGRHDHVLVFSPMSADLYAVLAGLWRVGAVAVFVDPSAGFSHVDRCCRMVRPRAFIGVPRAHLLRFALRRLGEPSAYFSIGGRVPFARTLSHGGRTSSPPRCEPLDASAPALLTFTSGSTGESKAVVRTHGSLIAQHRVVATELGLREGDRDLATLPMFVLANLASGVTSVLPDADMRRAGSVSVRAVTRQILATGPSRTAASPAFMERLLAAERCEPGLLHAFHRIYLGGAPVFPRLLRAASAAAPMADVVAVYGSTEAEPIAQVRWADTTYADRLAMNEGAGLLAGYPIAGIDVRILPERRACTDSSSPVEIERDSLPPGSRGEIVVAGDHVLTGNPGDAVTPPRSAGGTWHRTGDAGYIDARGRLWLMGRCSAKSEDRHGTLYPFSVECAVQEIEGVAGCALLAHNEERMLVIEPRRRSRAIAIEREVRAKLEWARLDRTVFVAALPRDTRHNSKIDYRALRRMLGSPC